MHLHNTLCVSLAPRPKNRAPLAPKTAPTKTKKEAQVTPLFSIYDNPEKDTKLKADELSKNG